MLSLRADQLTELYVFILLFLYPISLIAFQAWLAANNIPLTHDLSYAVLGLVLIFDLILTAAFLIALWRCKK